VRQLELPLDRSGLRGDVEADLGLVGHDGLDQGRVAEPQTAPGDVDDDPMSGLLLDDRPERFIQVDPAVGQPLDVQLGAGQLEGRGLGPSEEDLPEVPAENRPVGGDEPVPLLVAEDDPVDPRGFGPGKPDGRGFERAGSQDLAGPDREDPPRHGPAQELGKGHEQPGRHDQGRQGGDPPGTARAGAIRRSHGVSASFLMEQTRGRRLAPGFVTRTTPTILATLAPERAGIPSIPSSRRYGAAENGPGWCVARACCFWHCRQS
jgi:hypothetical protein